MSHELDQSTDGTQTAYVGTRTPAWHRLGTTMPDVDTLTIADAMKIAHLADWNVTKSPIVTFTQGGSPVPFPGKYATVRTNPFGEGHDPLGVVGDDYLVVQNEEALGFAQDILDTGEADVVTAGALRGGRQVWVLLALHRDITVGGTDDTIKPFLLVANSHDGSSAIHARLTMTRVVCANTLAQAFGERTAPTYRVRHTGEGLTGRIEDARAALGLAFDGLTAFQAEAEALYAQQVTNDEFYALTGRLFPVTEDDAKRDARNLNRRDSAYDLFTKADTQAMARNTGWGAAQALIEWADWLRQPTASPESKAKQQATSLGLAEWKSNAVKMVRALA